jgi:hypothetical protein
MEEVNFISRMLYIGRKAPNTKWIGGWVDLRAGLVAMEKRKTNISCPLSETNAHSLAVKLVVYSLCAMKGIAGYFVHRLNLSELNTSTERPTAFFCKS